MKKLLIAHQSTIPHYRVCFYNALEASRPGSWTFDVVFDYSEIEKKRFFQEDTSIHQFTFPVLATKTYGINLGEKLFNYQSFFLKAANYDLIVVGSALSNFTYSLCWLHKLFGKKYVIWGHGKDRSIAKPSRLKIILETFRLWLARNADGFLAYTSDIKTYLEEKGVVSSNIYVLNNTIDILKQRQFYENYRLERNKIKEQLGLSNRKILLFVGRFTKSKRLAFLLEAFEYLLHIDSNVHLIMVGDGNSINKKHESAQVTFLGGITDPDKLAQLYVASDIFVFPGDVGLGPLQALCYDLPIITIESATHMPEIVYLNQKNSIILSSLTTPKEYAKAVFDLYSDSAKLTALRSTIWQSIQHLTIEQMAQNFINGINHILKIN
jgi:glycosyltransferase involved in cell wall biosynthesis